VPIGSGDALHLGHTEIRVYRPDHPVAATAPLSRPGPIFDWIDRPLHVWASFVLALAVTLGWTWLEVWADEEGQVLAAAAATTAGIVVVWSAVWSVGGRLAHHKAHFRNHATIMSLYMIVAIMAWYIKVYIDFLTNENWLAQAATYAINYTLMAFLLYGSFTLATRMPHKRKLTAAGFFSFGIMAGAGIFTLVSAKSFNQQPIYPATLEPYLTQLAPAETVDKFMNGSTKLFSSGEFVQPAQPVAAAAKAPVKR
jgi:hypothetical protein